MSQDRLDTLLGLVAVIALGLASVAFLAFVTAALVIGTTRIIELIGGGG